MATLDFIPSVYQSAVYDFIRNSEGKYTTRNIYDEKTPFFTKFLDTYTGKVK